MQLRNAVVVKVSQYNVKTQGVKMLKKLLTAGALLLATMTYSHAADPFKVGFVYVGPVGVWMPWEPEAYNTGRVEYLEDELNQLMHEKNLNEAKAKQEFEKRIQDTKRKAIEENVKLARESGNKLTQRLDKEGNLVGVNNTIENDLKELDDTSSESIKKALFEGDNIVRKKKD